MVDFLPAVASELRSRLCAVLAVNETGYNLVRPLIPDFGQPVFNVPGALRVLVCNADPDDIEELAPPFTGGQCATIYRVDGTYVSNGDSSGAGCGTTRTWRINGATGPIGGIQVVFSPSPDIILQDGGFNTPPFDLATGGSLIPSETCGAAGSGNFRVLSMQITSVTRTDGLTDNCGDPPTVIPPTAPVEQPIEVTYNIDESTEITLEGTVIFAPFYIDLDGSINAPIKLDLGGFEWSGNIEVSPNFEVNLFPDGVINIPGDVDGTNEPFPDDPEDEVDPVDESSDPTIIGVEVFCQVNSDQASSSILFPGAPNIYAPRLGDVSFGVRTRTSVVWTSDIPIKNREAYIPNPAAQGAVAVRVRSEPGVTIRFNPVRERPLLEIE